MGRGGSAAALLTMLLALPACGDKPPSDAPATTVGASVRVPHAREAVLQSLGGGFRPAPPPGAACDPQVWSYTMALATQALAWTRCDVAGSGADPADYQPATGTRGLDRDESGALEAALQEIVVSDRTTCGADKPVLELTVRTYFTEQVYGDDFYACNGAYRYYVTSLGLDNLERFLRFLVP